MLVRFIRAVHPSIDNGHNICDSFNSKERFDSYFSGSPRSPLSCSFGEIPRDLEAHVYNRIR